VFDLVRQPKVDQCSLGAESVLTSGEREVCELREESE
jgi:hypothetical protein